MKRILLLVLVLVSWAMAEAEAPVDVERDVLNQALEYLGLSERELGFEKKWATDTIFRLDVVETLLDAPLEGLAYADRTADQLEQARDDLVRLTSLMAAGLDCAITSRDTLEIIEQIERQRGLTGLDVPQEAAISLSYLLASFEVAEGYLREGLSGLSERDIERLLIKAPVLWSDEADSTDDYLKGALHREYGVEVDTSEKIESDTILEIARRIEHRKLVLAAVSVMIGCERAKDGFALLDSTSLDVIDSRVVESKWGRIGIGSTENDEWLGDFAVILELGGDDRYDGRVAGAVGQLGSSFSVVVDLDGDDVYSSKKLFSLGASVFGVGVLIDCSGDDVYRGFHHSQGAGLFGTGILQDLEGDDHYVAGYYAQGAGNFGMGALIDGNGGDSYKSYNWAQGMGSVLGYGMLSDFGGHDVYYAGGRYFHRPLRPDDHRSFAQGFGMGWRPDASGGVGVLYDREGNDFYCAQVYAQGTSYWYSLGMLIDRAGNDYYNAAQYSQGAGIHLSVGVLVDEEGDDHYFSRYGPGQGEGHDLSSGILMDRKGNDSYMISGGQGIGLTNSFGLFIDGEGDDHYSSSEERFGQGAANEARGFGGIGIFLDLADTDHYPGFQQGDGAVWTSGVWGAGVDLDCETEEEKIAQLEPDTLLESVEDIFEIAELWGVGENQKRVRWARERLTEMGREAIDYVCTEKMGTKSGLAMRAIQELVEAMPDSILPCLLAHLDGGTPRTRANSIFLLGKAKLTEAIPHLREALKDEGNRPRWVLSAFGDMGDSEPLSEIYPYLKDDDETARIAAAVALGKIKDPLSTPELMGALDDEAFTVRSAVEKSLVSIGDSTVVPLTEALAGASARTGIHIIHALGLIGETLDGAESRATRVRIKKSLVPFLDDERSSLRGYAVEAIGRLGGDVNMEMLRTRMADELDPFVLGKYRAAVQ